jgi:hypothetical protein
MVASCFGDAVKPQSPIAAWLHKIVLEVDERLPAQAMDKLQGPILAWLRKLGPSETLSERTFRHCVSPSNKATAGIEPSSIANRRRRHVHLP